MATDFKNSHEVDLDSAKLAFRQQYDALIVGIEEIANKWQEIQKMLHACVPKVVNPIS